MVHEASAVATILFTDIEGSTRLWEQMPERMRPALARHDALARAAVDGNRGRVVKMTGDGLYAAFDDSLDAVVAALELQLALTDPAATHDVALRLRCGLHAGEVEQRDNDLFGSAINRAARIMGAAHGGQILLSQAVAERVRDRLPSGVTLRDLGSVRLRDLGRPERIYQIVHPQLRQDFPALRSLESTPNNLPQEITPFIGRERALAEVRQLLSNARLADTGGDGRARQDPFVAAVERGGAGRVCGRRVVRRTGAAGGCTTGCAGGRLGARRQGGAGSAGARSAAGFREGPAVAADPRQLRAPGSRLRAAGEGSAAVRIADEGPGVEPRAAARPG